MSSCHGRQLDYEQMKAVCLPKNLANDALICWHCNINNSMFNININMSNNILCQ